MKDIQIRCETLVEKDNRYQWVAKDLKNWEWDCFCDPQDASSHELYSAWKGEYGQGEEEKEAALEEWKARYPNGCGDDKIWILEMRVAVGEFNVKD